MLASRRLLVVCVAVSLVSISWVESIGATRETDVSVNAMRTRQHHTLQGAVGEVCAYSPRSLDFGTLKVGDSSTKSVIVTNTGEETLLVSPASLEGWNPGEYAITEGGSGAVLEPGATWTIQVAYSPTKSYWGDPKFNSYALPYWWAGFSPKRAHHYFYVVNSGGGGTFTTRFATVSDVYGTKRSATCETIAVAGDRYGVHIEFPWDDWEYSYSWTLSMPGYEPYGWRSSKAPTGGIAMGCTRQCDARLTFDIGGSAVAIDLFGGTSSGESVEPSSDRLYGRTRYSTAVRIAREGCDEDPNTPGTQWGDVTDVIIASGEDRAAADPLAASGLAWAYEAPLFLVSSKDVPAEVEQAVAEIKEQAGGANVTVHIVGGRISVPDARYTELNSAVGGGLEKHRVLATGGRYDLAAEIAREVKAANAGVAPEVVLIANGADPAKFFDALALSPIAANNGYPILLVSYDSIPSATTHIIDEFDPDAIVIGGGPNTVGSAVKNALARKAPTQQWYVGSRYTTAIRIADNAVARHWLSRSSVGIAAKLPDALTGGSMVGRAGGVLLITDGSRLTSEVGTWLTAHKGEIQRCCVFGGPNSVADSVVNAIEARLQ